MLLLFLTASFAKAQFTVDGQIRPRFEYRHGFRDLFPNQADPAVFVSQRSRITLGYKVPKLELRLRMQDIRVWGDVPQLNAANGSGFLLHEGWFRYHLDSSFALKVGRQEIVYDDSRIFGNVDWIQQARSHDAALLQFSKNGFLVDLGLAYNQGREALVGNVLTVPRTYKALQYLWLHKDWKNISTSLLLLNNGLQFVDAVDPSRNTTRYSQTVGTHLVHAKNKLKLAANAFYQFGKDVQDNELSAYLLSLEANYKVTKKLSAGLGGELISGNDNGTLTNGNNNAFNPFYGTNHKFNGLMDYFYVGNHADNVGLLDVYLKLGVKFSSKTKLNLAVHNFSAAAEFNNRQFGNEIDLAFSHKLHPFVTFQAGYSHLFQAEGMEILKGNTDGNINNWAYALVNVTPRLFQSKKK